jgi:hypothetical protein
MDVVWMAVMTILLGLTLGLLAACARLPGAAR